MGLLCSCFRVNLINQTGHPVPGKQRFGGEDLTSQRLVVDLVQHCLLFLVRIGLARHFAKNSANDAEVVGITELDVVLCGVDGVKQITEVLLDVADINAIINIMLGK